ncbi:hypothetical protein T09_9251 [Trichinella sp. T9]|nr:hypothetical protein T09_9251 [Trichinella sp. T9]
MQQKLTQNGYSVQANKKCIELRYIRQTLKISYCHDQFDITIQELNRIIRSSHRRFILQIHNYVFNNYRWMVETLTLALSIFFSYITSLASRITTLLYRKNNIKSCIKIGGMLLLTDCKLSLTSIADIVNEVNVNINYFSTRIKAFKNQSCSGRNNTDPVGVTWPRGGTQKSRVGQEQYPRTTGQIAIWASGGSESESERPPAAPRSIAYDQTATISWTVSRIHICFIPHYQYAISQAFTVMRSSLVQSFTENCLLRGL